MRGFLFIEHGERFVPAVQHLASLIAAGKLRDRETIVDGLEHARDTLNRLFAGANTGKLLVKVAEPTTGPAVQAVASAAASTV